MRISILFLSLNLIFICIYCSEQNNQPQSAVIYGTIKNVNEQNLKINNQDITITGQGLFEYRLELKTPAYIQFSLGEVTLLFLERGDSLNIEVDADKFFETISLSGSGKEVNRFLVDEALEAKKVSQYFNTNYLKIVTSDEKDYLTIADSLRTIFETLFENFIKENRSINKYFIDSHKKMVLYGWAELLLQYPNWYRQFAGKSDFEPSEQFFDYMDLLNFNDPGLLVLDEYKTFLKNYIDINAGEELKKNPLFGNKNYKLFRAKFHVVLNTFTDPAVKSEMLYYITEPFLSEYNTKGMEDLLNRYLENSSNQGHRAKIEKLVQDDKNIQKQCDIQVYKTVDNTTLDAFIYRPKDLKPGEHRPALAFFHGGGWECGKPETVVI